jgi:hypothetical protein
VTLGKPVVGGGCVVVSCGMVTTTMVVTTAATFAVDLHPPRAIRLGAGLGPRAAQYHAAAGAAFQWHGGCSRLMASAICKMS